VPEASTQTPDYQIELSDHLVIAEVKQLDENEEDKRAWEECRKRGSAGSFPGSDSRVRRKIHAANPQLKRLTAGQHPGVLVLYSNTSLGNYDPEDLHNAMFGSETYTIAYPRDRSSEPVFMGASLAQDGLLAKDRNTSTSAIISLRHAAAGEFSIAFYHNKFAQVPIAPDWLRCNSVRHFASQDRPGKAIPFWVEV
jgi:hypothetical protein